LLSLYVAAKAAGYRRVRLAAAKAWTGRTFCIERIRPGHPQQNGRHERMHLTLKKEATRPPGMNSLQQQAKFDTFMREFNTERPHEALAMRMPAEVYAPSTSHFTAYPK
jgi:transposase InsO family protein